MPAYDSSFNPAAPIADVTIVHPVKPTKSISLRGKMDTGADVTVIPEQLVTQLGLIPKETFGRVRSTVLTPNGPCIT